VAPVGSELITSTRRDRWDDAVAETLEVAAETTVIQLLRKRDARVVGADLEIVACLSRGRRPWRRPRVPVRARG
jgi:hypothetical protein